MGIPEVHSVMLLTHGHLENDILTDCCKKITTITSNKIVWESSKSTLKKSNDAHLYVIKNVPEYLDVKFLDNGQVYARKYFSIKGFALALDGYTDANSYLRDVFKSKGRTKILKPINRLENCFEITFKSFHGEIDQDECLQLLRRLKQMIIARFKERNEVSDSIKEWESIEKSLYHLILEKKASLFVLYNESKPIAISICYHYGDVLFSYITSYDISFYKFSLGNIMIYKKLEVCFKNKYKYLDMGWGELDYKKKWCNLIYTLQHNILLPNKSPLTLLIAYWEGNKTRLNLFLKKNKLRGFILKIKSQLIDKEDTPTKKIAYAYEEFKSLDSFEDLTPIDFKAKKSLNLEIIRNDFIFNTQELSSNVKLYQSKKDGFYILKGKNYCKKIVWK